MMMTEFVERTGFEPTVEEYREIEEAYYSFEGDKNAFCKHWAETVGEKGMLKARAAEIENLRREIEEQRREFETVIEEQQKQIERLNQELEREQEWKPWANDRAVKQEEYDHLRSCGSEMTDERAARWIADEWGFDQAKIRINRKMKTYDVNRHHCLRQSGEIDRSPYYDATDWYYVFFTVCGMEYEAYNGSLTQL